MSLIAKDYRSMYYDMLLNFIFFGITLTVIGSVLPRILQDFHWSYAETGFILAAGSIGNFTATFLAGYLINRFGLRTVMACSLCIIGVGNLAFGLISAVAFNLAASLLTGLGQGALEVVVNSSVVHMERKGESHLMGFMHASFSIGAVTGPLIIGALLSAGGAWQLMFRTMGVLFLVAAFLPFFLPFDRIKDGRRVAAIPAGDVLPAELARQPLPGRKKPIFDFGKGAISITLIGALAILLYVGMELGISNWVSEYFVKRFDLAASQASLVVALFWGGILAGRIAIPLLAKSIPLINQLLVLTCFSAVAVFLISLLPGPLLASAGILLAGLGCSAIYPLIMSLVGQYLTKNQSVGLSIVSTGGGIGAFTFPFLMALIAQQFGLIIGFSLLTIMGVLLIISCVVLFFRVRSLACGIH